MDGRRSRSAYKLQRSQRQEAAKRTIFVRDIDYSITEEMLAILFGRCGTVLDCRSCGGPTSGLRSIVFQDEGEAHAALCFDKAIIGVCPLKVSLSRTAIIPINPMFLPQSEAEREVCLRTVYCSNISKIVNKWDLKAFFEGYFSEVSRMKVLDDDRHATNVAFIEFAEIHGVVAALQSSCIYAGGIPIRLSPSKTTIKS